MSIYEYDAEKHIRMEREDAKEEGGEEGLQKSGVLIRTLMDAGRYEELWRSAEDESYRRQLFIELGIS